MNQNNIIDKVDPSRRSFVMRLLGGAAFVAPLISTFAIDSLTAQAQEPLNCNLTDEGYVGPNEFQAFLSGPGTRATGVATFEIASTSQEPPVVCLAKVTYSLQLTKGASATNGVIVLEGKTIVNLPVGTPAAIGAPNLIGLCDLDELLTDLRSGKAKMNLQVLAHGEEFVLSGPITPAVNSFIIELSPKCKVLR